MKFVYLPRRRMYVNLEHITDVTVWQSRESASVVTLTTSFDVSGKDAEIIENVMAALLPNTNHLTYDAQDASLAEQDSRQQTP